MYLECDDCVFLVLMYLAVNYVSGRYAVRYGRVATEAVRKQMAQIPGGLVRFFVFLSVISNVTCKQIHIQYLNNAKTWAYVNHVLLAVLTSINFTFML